MRHPLLVLALALAPVLLAGCGGGDDEAATTLPPLPSATTAAPATTSPAPAATEAPTRAATAAPTTAAPTTMKAPTSKATTKAPVPAGPATAVRGFLTGLKTGGAEEACAFSAPAERADCVSELADFTRITVADFAIGDVAVQGDQAIVTFTSQGGICFDSFCTRNSDRSAGQPGAGVSFEKAYAAVDGGGTPQWLVKRVGGTWWVTG